MGDSKAVDPRRRFVYPFTPPGLSSPSASESSRSSSLGADQAQVSRASAQFFMPEYEQRSKVDMPADSNVEVNQSRAEAVPRSGPRQQLPSLTSLFGPPTARPAGSPHSERYPSHPVASPLDRPGQTPSDRANAQSYFPPTSSPTVSQPRSAYDLKFDVERQSRHALCRSFSGSGSPGYRDISHNGSRSVPEPDAGARWSLQQEARASEYAIASREAVLRSAQDHQFRLQIPGSKDGAVGYSDQRSGPGGPNPPPTPTSTAGSEGLPSKDGLGPKIWTGTHFLPRFVKAAEVSGEGMCYFYDDGTHCKTVIDGEAVNAHWGVTKAGKPRKRLAIACITCREKKIKCDPDFPRCVQCEKFGRICKFKNAPRGGHNTSPTTPPADLDEYRKLAAPLRSNEMLLVPASKSNSPVSPRETIQSHSPETMPKRLKLGPDAFVTTTDQAADSASGSLDHSKSQLFTQRSISEMPRIPEEVLSRAWRTDPYVSDPSSINATISQFFANIEGTMVLKFLPEDAFKAWVVRSVNRKSSEDSMLLYSILAVGVALSGGPKHIAFEYAQVAHYAQKQVAVDSVQLVQSRILLAVYYASVLQLCECTELTSAAAGTAACMQLNLELDQSNEAALPVFPIGLNKAAYAEVRRRTFWSLFMLERLNGMFPERWTMLDAEDIFIRLPGDSESFEKQNESRMPTFNPYESSFRNVKATDFEPRSYLVEMAHIWSNCQAEMYRMSRRSQPAGKAIEAMQRLIGKLLDWQNALPDGLLFGTSNLESACSAGNASAFLTMHLLQNHALIKINRYRHEADQLPSRIRADNLKQCCDSASNILEMSRSLDQLLRVKPVVLRAPPPMMAVVVTEAVDVLTARAALSRLGEITEITRTAKTLIESMDSVWEESRRHREAIDKRLRKLVAIRDRGSQPTNPTDGYRVLSGSTDNRDEEGRLWQFADPIETLYPKGMDIVYNYGAEERRTYLPA